MRKPRPFFRQATLNLGINALYLIAEKVGIGGGNLFVREALFLGHANEPRRMRVALRSFFGKWRIGGNGYFGGGLDIEFRCLVLYLLFGCQRLFISHLCRQCTCS
jgi:hypothetical protein